VYGFRKLAAYEKAVGLANDLRISIEAWGSFDRWTIGVQAQRAADSIGANIAEGYGRGPFADRRRFLFIARGSQCELEHWLHGAAARGLPCPDQALERVNEVGRILNGLIRSNRPNGA
jgi:four helix bundle protein